MDSLFPLRDLREKLEIEAAREQTYPTCLTSRQCLALLEVAEAARDIYGLPQAFQGFAHGESDEITCRCGWQSQLADYAKACAALERHIRREEKKVLDAVSVKHKRLDDALAAFDWSAS